MLQCIRLAMQDDLGGTLGGNVEVGETFVGGKVRNMHKERKLRAQKDSRLGAKTIVVGMLERGGDVRATVVKDRSKQSMREVAQTSVDKGSEILPTSTASSRQSTKTMFTTSSITLRLT